MTIIKPKPILSAKPITRLHKVSYPMECIFFDTERWINKDSTDITNEPHSFRLGVLIYVKLNKQIDIEYREVYYFNSVNQFWDYVVKRLNSDRTLFLYAHNAKYDTLSVDIINNLKVYGFDTPFPTVNNAFIISAKKGRKQLKIVDTFNYERTSVFSMGSKLGIDKISLDDYRSKSRMGFSRGEKLKGDINFNTIPDNVLIPYCENDVLIIEKWMINFIKLLHDNDLGGLGYTTASTALKIYRHKFISDAQIYYHKDDLILRMERAAYRGGIVECFSLNKLKKQNYTLLDINSMYVSVMSKELLPTYPISYNNQPTLEDLTEAVHNNYIIADVLLCVTSNNGYYGIKHNGKLIFPNGEFRITLHQPELQQAIKDNTITTVFNYTSYYADYALKEYANYFSELKKNATNPSDRDLYKKLGNAFYGRLGMRKYLSDKFNFDLLLATEDEQKEYELNLSKDTKAKLVVKNKPQTLNLIGKGLYYLWNDEYVRTYTDDFQHVPRTNVALAGAVTAYARCLMAGYINKAGRENLYYSDTDSLVVNDIALNRLSDMIDNQELGKLKQEFTFNSGIIKAPKNYTFSLKKTHHIKHYGLMRTRKNQNPYILNQKSIILKRRDRSKGIPTSAVNNNGTFEFMAFTTFKDYLRSNGRLNGRIKRHRTNTYKYSKGYFNKNKKLNPNQTTQPFNMRYIINEDSTWLNQIENLNQTKQTKQQTTNKKTKQKKMIPKKQNLQQKKGS